jgi:adhesin transport system membrane fusion protein
MKPTSAWTKAVLRAFEKGTVERGDIDFMAEIDAARHMRPARASHVLLASIAALVALFFLWAGLCAVDERVRASGQVVPSREIQTVQSLEGGILAELLVSEGDRVEKDQILMRISDVAFSSEETSTEARSLSLKAKRARLEAEARASAFTPTPEILAGNPRAAENEQALYRSRQDELANALSILDGKIEGVTSRLSEVETELTALGQSRTLLQQELGITQDMVRQKAAPKLEEIRLQRELTEISGKIASGKERKTGLEADLRNAKKEREDQEDKFRSQALGELSEVDAQIAGLEGNLKSIGDRVYRSELRAPAGGIVNKIAVKTIGGVIEPAQRLVEIVPVDEDLKIVARVSPNDIAFLKAGQSVHVRISAYDPNRYGRLNGHLVRVGANSVVDREGHVFFEIEVRTDRNHLGTMERPLPITPGMLADVDIVTGRRTILEYLAKPLLRARTEALRER